MSGIQVGKNRERQNGTREQKQQEWRKARGKRRERRKVNDSIVRPTCIASRSIRCATRRTNVSSCTSTTWIISDRSKNPLPLPLHDTRVTENYHLL